MMVTKQQFLDMVATMVAGIFSNPASGNLLMDS